jgi:hypothetical protein
MDKTFNTPREFIQAVMTSAQKARSNIVEGGYEDVGASLFPKLWTDDWDNILTVADRMLADGREPTGQDAVNLSYLIHRNEELSYLLAIWPVTNGYEEFPGPMECMARWAGVGL